MFRLVTSIGLVVALAACSKPGDTSAATGAKDPVATSPSADALAAVAVGRRYFDLLRARDYPAAFALWTNQAETTGDAAKRFAAAQQAIGRVDGHVGAPSIVRVSNGERFVLVDIAATVTPPSAQRTAQYGVLMLKRPAAGDAGWRIWGVDLRKRHCPKGQRPHALGCVQA